MSSMYIRYVYRDKIVISRENPNENGKVRWKIRLEGQKNKLWQEKVQKKENLPGYIGMKRPNENSRRL